jgi:membrane protease YdiL (CAAX protease family)
MATENPFSRIKTGTLLGVIVFFYYGCLLVFGLIAKCCQISIDSQIKHNLIYIFECLLILVWIRGQSKAAGLNLRLFFRPTRKVSMIYLSGITVLLMISGAGATLVYYALLVRLFPTLIKSLLLEQNSFSAKTSQPVLNAILEILTTAFLAPVVEELLFRGVLLNRWSMKWGIRMGVLSSSIAFAIIHSEFFRPFIVGVCLSLLYIKTRSLPAPILVHGLNNACAVAGEFMVRPVSHSREVQSLDDLRFGLWIGVSLLVMTSPFVLVYVYRNWPVKNADIPYRPDQTCGVPGPQDEMAISH